MEYGEVILEHRPIVICQCQNDKCLACDIDKGTHPDKDNVEYWDEKRMNGHDFYQRSPISGPRVVIDNKTFRGVCFKCKKEYEVEVKNISDKVEGQIKYDEVVPY